MAAFNMNGESDANLQRESLVLKPVHDRRQGRVERLEVNKVAPAQLQHLRRIEPALERDRVGLEGVKGVDMKEGRRVEEEEEREEDGEEVEGVQKSG